jgi:glycogen debranching enzyme
LYYLAGIPDYHRTLIWPWLGTLNAVGKDRLGDRTGALTDLARIGEWYIRGNAVNEVYDAVGKPVSRRFYQAEVPFAWNAGMYVYAVHTLGLAPASQRGAGDAPR